MAVARERLAKPGRPAGHCAVLVLAALCCAPVQAGEIRVAFAISDDIFLAPVFAAEKLGYFRAADIDVRRLNIRGAEAIQQALKSGQADIIDASGPAVAQAFPGGDGGKIVATAASGFYGWTVIAPENSPLKSLQQLAGKTVGISSTHSLSDMAAQLAAENKAIKFEISALGAGSMVPTLRAGKVDAILSSALIGLREAASNRAQIVFDLGVDRAPFLVSGYVASTRMMEMRERDLRAFLNAVFQAQLHMRNDRKWAIDLLREYARIGDNAYAEQVYDRVVAQMSADPQTNPDTLREALELAARAWKQPELAGLPVQPLYTNEFVTVSPAIPAQ